MGNDGPSSGHISRIWSSDGLLVASRFYISGNNDIAIGLGARRSQCHHHPSRCCEESTLFIVRGRHLARGWPREVCVPFVTFGSFQFPSQMILL